MRRSSNSSNSESGHLKCINLRAVLFLKDNICLSREESTMYICHWGVSFFDRMWSNIIIWCSLFCGRFYRPRELIFNTGNIRKEKKAEKIEKNGVSMVTTPLLFHYIPIMYHKHCSWHLTKFSGVGLGGLGREKMAHCRITGGWVEASFSIRVKGLIVDKLADHVQKTYHFVIKTHLHKESDFGMQWLVSNKQICILVHRSVVIKRTY